MTPNADHIVQILEDENLYEIYRDSYLVFADGMPIVWLSSVLPGMSLKARVTGSDLIFEVVRCCQDTDLKILFVGGAPGIARRAKERLELKYPGVNLLTPICPPFGFEESEELCRELLDECNMRDPDIIFVGLGCPKQEQWAHANLNRLKCGPILCTGAAFDFAAGTKSRAPRALQKIGLEWLWRLGQEPLRLGGRYLFRTPRFILYSVREVVMRWTARV